MKKSIFKPVFLVAIIGAFLFSCVPARQYEVMKKKNDSCDTSRAKLQKENTALTEKNAELQLSLDNITKRINGLELDSTVRGTSLRTMTSNYGQLNKTYELLLANNKDLLAGNNSETQKILVKLKTTQDSLLDKEDTLKKLASDLNAKKTKLDKMDKELDSSKAQLESENTKLSELQSILMKKDSSLKALKNKVTDALNVYEGDGLTVTQKNGKINVSLEESLLFATGSFAVNPKGVEAIKKLAKVLEANPDINVLIEGHTDNVPYTVKGPMKDNWDLSVMRATAIVKIITENSKVNPKQLTAAGRSEYDPIESNSTKEGKAKNRRTEIILTPKLDELFKIIDQN